MITKIKIVAVTLACLSFFVATQSFGQSVPTINPWTYIGSGTKQIKPVASTTKVLIGANTTSTNSFLETPSLTVTGLINQPCLGTNSSGVLGTGTCSGGTGGSNWTILSGGLRTSTTTDFVQAANFIATSTTATSTFPVLYSATATVSHLNGVITVDGVRFAKTMSGIQEALNYASSTNARVVHLPCGDYGFISSRVTVPGNMTLRGDGYCTLMTATSTGGFDVFQDNVTIESIHTEASDPTQRKVIYINNAKNVTISKSFILNNYSNGVFIGAKNGCCSYATTSNIRVTDNTLTGLGNNDVIGGGPDVIEFQKVEKVYIARNTIEQHPEIVGSAGYQNAVDIVGVNEITYTDNKTIGALVFGSEQTPNQASSIIGNIITATASSGKPNSALVLVVARPAYVSLSNPMQDIIVANNVVSGGYIQVTGSTLQRGNNFIINGNTVRAYGNNFSVLVQYMNLGVISNNNLSGGGTGINVFDSSNVSTVNNVVKDSFAYGYSESASGDNLISGNNFLKVGVPIPFRMDTLNENTIVGQNYGNFDSSNVFPGTTQLYGKVGIGTSSPTAILSISTQSSSSLGLVDLFNIASSTNGLSTTTVFRVSSAGLTTGYSGFNTLSGCYAVSGVCLVSNTSNLTGSGTTGLLTSWSSSSGLTSITNPTLSVLTATSTTGTSSFMGAVGIGTTTPSAKFVVVGDTRVTGNIRTANGSASTPAFAFESFPSYGAYFNSATGMVFSHNGSDAFGVRSNFLSFPSNASLGWTNGGITASFDTNISRLSAAKVGVGNGTNGNATGTLVAGTIGIGTSVPSTTLHVVGTTTTSNLALTGAFTDSTSAIGTNGNVLLSTGTSTRWVATSSLGISGGGGFSDPLTTNGDIIARIAGATTRLPQGANGTFLGVSGGVLGYYTPSGGGGSYIDLSPYDYVIRKSGSTTIAIDASNGSTVSSSTNADVPIQFAIDALLTGGGIFLDKGDYVVATSVVIKSNITFVGLGAQSYLKATTSMNKPVLTNKAVFDNATNTNIIIRDIKFDGDKANQTVAFSTVYLKNITNSEMTGVTANGALRTGVFPGALSTWGEGIRLANSSHVRMSNIEASDNSYDGVKFWSVFHSTLDGLVGINNGANAFQLTYDTDPDVDSSAYNTISNITVRHDTGGVPAGSNGTKGITIDGGRDNTITNVAIWGTKVGFQMVRGVWRNTISNMVINQRDGTGIYAPNDPAWENVDYNQFSNITIAPISGTDLDYINLLQNANYNTFNGVNAYLTGSSSGSWYFAFENNTTNNSIYNVHATGSRIYNNSNTNIVSYANGLVTSSDGNVGIGTSSASAQLTVRSSTLGEAISNFFGSNGSSSAIIGEATTTVRHSSLLAGFKQAVLAQVAIGIDWASGYLGSGRFFGALNINGLFYQEGWNQVDCSMIVGAVQIATDGTTGCDGFTFMEDNTVTLTATGNGGNMYGRLSSSVTADGGGIFLNAPVAGGLIMASNTPKFMATARIHSVQNQGTTTFDIIGFSNINTSGTTFEVFPTAGCFFAASTTQANWRAICQTSLANTTNVDTGIASTTVTTGDGVPYTFIIETDTTGAKFFMKSSEAGNLTQVANITTTVPTTTAMNAGLHFGRPSGVTAVGLDVYEMNIGWRKFLAR